MTNSIKTLLCMGAVASTILSTGSAFAAVTITNNDSKTHTVVIDTGKDSKQEKVDAGKSITADCPEKCGFRDLAFGTSRLAGGDAKLVIDKDGELHFPNGSGDFEMKNGTN